MAAAAAQMWYPCPVDDCPVSVVVPVHLSLVGVSLDDDDRPVADVSLRADLQPFKEHLRHAHHIVPKPADEPSPAGA